MILYVYVVVLPLLLPLPHLLLLPLVLAHPRHLVVQQPKVWKFKITFAFMRSSISILASLLAFILSLSMALTTLAATFKLNSGWGNEYGSTKSYWMIIPLSPGWASPILSYLALLKAYSLFDIPSLLNRCFTQY